MGDAPALCQNKLEFSQQCKTQNHTQNGHTFIVLLCMVLVLVLCLVLDVVPCLIFEYCVGIWIWVWFWVWSLCPVSLLCLSGQDDLLAGLGAGGAGRMRIGSAIFAQVAQAMASREWGAARADDRTRGAA
jgi:hypothetical protein